MKLMIIYGTVEGHTRTICEYLRDEAEKEGHSVALIDSTVTPPAPGEYDAVIIAGALLYTKYDFMKRFIMRVITKRAVGDTDTSQDFVYTDWDQVSGIMQKIEQN
jgi:menaquinone-dependent protoporphyrinogen IX oxidase